MSVVTIGGKRFTHADLAKRSVRMDHFMTAVFRKTGVDKITPTSEEATDPAQFLMRMQGKLIASGHACEVLSAFLLPEGLDQKDWRVETARQVQEHLESANTEEDRMAVNQLAFEAMTGFFRRGLVSLMTLLGSSRPGEGSDEAEPRPDTASAAA